jgi:signal transduction histidine kinase
MARTGFRPASSLVLTLGIVVIIVGLMAASTVIDVRQRRSDARTALMARGDLLATAASQLLGEPVNEADTQGINSLSRFMWGQPDIAYVNVFDGSGQLLVGPGEDQVAPPGVSNTAVIALFQDSANPVMEFRGNFLDVRAPVRSGARLVGAAQFGFNTDRIDEEIADLTRDRILLTLALVCLGVTVAFFLANNFVRPIRQLVKVTEQIASGSLATRVLPMPGREMSELGDSFNTMAGELEDMVVALQASRARILSGEERVRREIAGHLHGPVQGRLLALRAQLDELLRHDGMPSGSASRLGEIISDMGNVIQSDIAVLSRRLFPAIVRRGLIPALQSLGDQFESTLVLTIRFPDEFAAAERDDSNLVPERTRLVAYRIAYEALTNAVKHAGGSNVSIAVDLPDARSVRLSIQDDGPGFDSDVVLEGLGLTAMRDYAEAVGGECTISSHPGRGTLVLAHLPFADEAVPAE